MITNKKIRVQVNKPYEYLPVPQKEVSRVKQIVVSEIIEVANRFDGPCQIEILIKAKGNA